MTNKMFMGMFLTTCLMIITVSLFEMGSMISHIIIRESYRPPQVEHFYHKPVDKYDLKPNM